MIFIGNTGAKFLQFLMLPLYTRWLNVEEFGTADTINIYAMLLLGVVTCCIYDAIFVFPKGGSSREQSSYFSSGLSFALLSFSGVALLFGCIRFLFATSSFLFVDNIWLIYMLLIALFFQQYMQQFTRSIDKMKIYTVAGILVVLLSVLFSFVLVPHYKIDGYIGALFFGNIGAAIYSCIASKAYTYFRWSQIDWTVCRKMLSYSIPLIPNSIMWWLVTSFNRPMLETYMDVRSIGIFALANKFPAALTLVITVFTQSWQISVLEEFGTNEYRTFYNQVFRGITLLALFGSCLMAIFSQDIVHIFATADYEEAWIYISILTLGVAFSCMSSLAGTNFSAVKQSKYYFYSSLGAGLSAIILNFLLIPRWGIMGAAISVCASFMVGALSRIYYSWRFVPLDEYYKYLLAVLVNLIVIIFLYVGMQEWSMKLICLLFSLLSFMFLSKKDWLHLYDLMKHKL